MAKVGYQFPILSQIAVEFHNRTFVRSQNNERADGFDQHAIRDAVVREAYR